jgi:triosephosphate isomerase
MRRPIIAGNWKMNMTIDQSLDLAAKLKPEVAEVNGTDIILCPPFTALFTLSKVLRGTNISLGAQDVYWEEKGAYTGEVAPGMLSDVGCQYVIIGHSERRHLFAETNQSVNKKVKSALKSNLTPIICVGERLDERERGVTQGVVEEHVRRGLEGLSREEALRVVIAYEPVWAIGTGKTATPLQAQEVHSFIRGLLGKLYDKVVSSQVRIQYGGSVKPETIADLMKEEDVDGALVGGASLDAKSFAQIVKYERG